MDMQQLRKGHPSLLYMTKKYVFFFVTWWPVQESSVLERFGWVLHWAQGAVQSKLLADRTLA